MDGQTSQEQIKSLLSQLLGSAMPFGAQAGNFLGGLGIGGLSPYNRLAYSNGSAADTFRSAEDRLMQGQISSEMARASKEAQRKSLEQWYTGWGYKGSDLKSKIADARANPLSLGSLAVDFLDPYGMQGASQTFGQFATTARRVMGPGFGNARRAGQAAGDIMTGLLAEPEGMGSFNMTQYGSILTELAGSGALSKQLSGGKVDVAGIREKLKSMSKALEPLKSVFGEDIPKLLDILDNISGSRAFTSFKGSELSRMTYRLQGIMQTTGMSAQALGNVSNTFETLYEQQGLNPLGKHLLVGDYAMLTQGPAGLRSDAYSQSQIQRYAAQGMISKESSRFASDYKTAFGLYALNKGLSTDEELRTGAQAFKASYDEARKTGTGAIDALKNLSGASTVAGMRSVGAGLSETLWAERNVSAWEIASDEQVDSKMNIIRKRLAGDEVATELLNSGFLGATPDELSDLQGNMRKKYGIEKTSAAIQAIQGTVSYFYEDSKKFNLDIQQANKNKKNNARITLQAELNQKLDEAANTPGRVFDIFQEMGKGSPEISDLLKTAFGKDVAGMFLAMDPDILKGISADEGISEKDVSDTARYLLTNASKLGRDTLSDADANIIDKLGDRNLSGKEKRGMLKTLRENIMLGSKIAERMTGAERSAFGTEYSAAKTDAAKSAIINRFRNQELSEIIGGNEDVSKSISERYGADWATKGGVKTADILSAIKQKDSEFFEEKKLGESFGAPTSFTQEDVLSKLIAAIEKLVQVMSGMSKETSKNVDKASGNTEGWFR
ncbi:MAG: hypothetical protein WC907_05925 [Acholeplasmataceae bacterium]